MTRQSFLLSLLLAVFWSSSPTVLGYDGDSTLLIDGRLEEPLWESVEPITLQPAEKGLPGQLAASARVLNTNSHLYLGAVIPEPNGKVLAYSIGYNPIWEKNVSTYFFDLDRILPPTEDRFVGQLEFGSSKLRLEINPWGALQVTRDGRLVSTSAILVATSVDKKGWSLETAIPLEELDLAISSPKTVAVKLEQIRSRRPLAPEFRWKGSLPVTLSPSAHEQINHRKIEKRFRNDLPVLEVGRVQAPPPLDASWEGPFWSRVPTFHLQRNEPNPRRPLYPTQVKWVHDGTTLSVLFRCLEDTQVTCNIQRRDDRVDTDDHVCLYLATTGSSLVEIQVNPTGAIKDQVGLRNNIFFDGIGEWRKIGYAHTNWSANIKTHPLITKDSWYARIDVPLDEVTRALGETQLPANWKVLIGRVRQRRLGEPREISSIPVVESPSFRAPARYRLLRLSQLSPAAIASPIPEFPEQHLEGLAGELAELDIFALSRFQRRYRDVPGMLSRSVGTRVTALALEEEKEWSKVETLEDWERYRDKRMDFLKASFGDFPENRTPLNARETGVFRGDGFQVRNVVFESRPGIFVTANLYLPAKPLEQMPAIIINPGHMMPKTQEVNKDCGMIWAKAGCAVLVPDKVGHGERVETLPWNSQAYYSEEMHDMQLGLIGQSRQGWIAWDISRAVDFLLELGSVDPSRIILMGGATWGAGPTAATAGFLEDRLAATVIFNFGRVYWYTGGGWRLRDSTSRKIPDWFFCASKAPRKFVYAHEFWFEGEEGPDYPSVWVPAWPRYEKVYGLYGASENLANAQSDGLLRLDTGHCGSIDHLARREIYPLLNRWFDIPFPSPEDQSIEIDSQYGTDRRDYPLIKYKEAQRRMPDWELVCITPEVNAELERKPLHQIALEKGLDLLEKARQDRATMDLAAKKHNLTKGLSQVLGEMGPIENPEVEELWTRDLSGAEAEALVVNVEPGVFVPLFILTPPEPAGGRYPVVIALAEGGKARFLQNRSVELSKLLKAGIAVCLPDLRGTGETSTDQYKTASHGQLYDELALGTTIVGQRLKDLRTLIRYLKKRDDLDPERISLWGDSFAPPNQEEIFVDEFARAPVSPQIQHWASPMGSHLALLGALYEPEIETVAVRGGLAGYQVLLENPFTYVPFDIAVPEILRIGDIPDICAALAPMPLFVEQFVDGRNFIVNPENLKQRMRIALDSYERKGGLQQIHLQSNPGRLSLTDWLIQQILS